MSALYPNVPIGIGVPPVLRNALSTYQDVQTQLTTNGEASNAETAREWGLFTQEGILAVEADNVMAVEVALEARISDYPVAPTDPDDSAQTVGFASYNKVQVPIDIRLVMSKGGTIEDRQQFLKSVQDAYLITDLFNVVTPEQTYLDMNVVGVRQVRAGDRGATLMTLEVTLREVRQSATLSFTNTQDAASAGQVSDGPVQAAQVPASLGTAR